MYNLSVDLDYESKIPLYIQIYNFIISEIKKGNLTENQKLPSKRKLAENLGISVNTADSAYQMLCAEGYIISKPQSGFYVCEMQRSFGAESSKNTVKEDILPIKKDYLYDATTGNIDSELFPYKVWGRLQREVLSIGDSLLGYGDRRGDMELRSAINEYLHEYRGVNSSVSQIFVGAGLEYLIGLLACMLRKHKFAVEEPGYKKVYEIICNNGCEAVFVNVDENGIKLDELRQSNADIVYLTPSHQYPTGANMPISRRYNLLSWAAEKPNRYIIEDDYDSEFRFDRKPINALQGLDENDKVIYLGTFSRCLAPSIRIAYMVLPKSLLKEFNDMYSSYSATVSRMEQQTLAKFIEGGHFARHLSRIRMTYKKRRDCLMSSLYSEFGKDKIKIYGEHTGIHMLVSFSSNLSEDYICRKAEEEGIKIKGLSEYKTADAEMGIMPTLVMGYGALSENDIKNMCKILSKIMMLNAD